MGLRSSLARGLLRAPLLGALVLSACTGSPSPPAKVYRVGLLFGSTQAGAALDLDTFRGALRDLGYAEGRNLSLEVRYADGSADRDPALAAELVASKVDVLVTRQFAEAVALLYVGGDVADIVRRAAADADRIEKGAKVTDLPVEGPSRYELVINMKTAKALGLTIPQSVLGQATDVIQ